MLAGKQLGPLSAIDGAARFALCSLLVSLSWGRDCHEVPGCVGLMGKGRRVAWRCGNEVEKELGEGGGKLVK